MKFRIQIKAVGIIEADSEAEARAEIDAGFADLLANETDCESVELVSFTEVEE